MFQAHFVHLKKGLTLNESLYTDDGLAVIGVFFGRGNDARPLEPLERPLQDSYAFGKRCYIRSSLCRRTLRSLGSSAEVRAFKPFDMLPENHQVFYRYNGSLTTPGCNEAVVWTLLAEPMSVTETQVKL